MAKVRATVTTPWAGSGTEADPYRPKVFDDFKAATGGLATEDVTGQLMQFGPPDPNLVTVDVVAEQATIDAIEAHADYVVLASEEVPDAT